jgi:hypothetical protein
MKNYLRFEYINGWEHFELADNTDNISAEELDVIAKRQDEEVIAIMHYVGKRPVPPH